MKWIKRSQKTAPRVSLILLDWGVRESFHLCHYLKKQTLPADQFEVVLIEYYSAPSKCALDFEEQLDTYCLLEMGEEHYYHKHLMYNIGFLLSHGEIVVICDSDAMVKPTFIHSIVDHFDRKKDATLHLDQFRNQRRDLYPFCYPTFEEVISVGCTNYANGVTTGITATCDLLHARNYGACFCCRREDYIAVGGADEHIDFVGHICGPYDLTFRLTNLGRKEMWHKREFLYHTWHPGSDGAQNYLGPHDGYNLSSRAFDTLLTKRILPHVSNPLVKKLQEGGAVNEEEVARLGITFNQRKITHLSFLKNKKQVAEWAETHYSECVMHHYLVKKEGALFKAYPIIKEQLSSHPRFTSTHLEQIKRQTKQRSPLQFLLAFYRFCSYLIASRWKDKKKTLSSSWERKERVLLRFSHAYNLLRLGPFRRALFKTEGPVYLLVNSLRECYIYQELLRTQAPLLNGGEKQIMVQLLDAPLKEKGTLFATPTAYTQAKATFTQKVYPL